MKAVVYEKYGPPEVLKLKDVDKPKPGDDEMLVKIHAATVTSGDVRLRGSDFPALVWLPARLIFGLFKPRKRILGHELAGIVEATGKNITEFKVGDQVFGTTTMLKAGSYAEYVCLPQKWNSGVIGIKPANLSFQEAAALPIGAMTALYLLEKANLGSGQQMLVYGASGSVGSYAIQFANQKGSSVKAVCSTANFEIVKSLGAASVLDYKKEDYSEGNEKFDIVFDAVGKTTKSKAKKVLKPGGAFVSVTMLTNEKDEHLKLIKDMAEKGELKPFIDQSFTLNEIVEAHEYVDKGRKRGNVVIDILK